MSNQKTVKATARFLAKIFVWFWILFVVVGLPAIAVSIVVFFIRQAFFT